MNEGVLLDTHIVLWMDNGDERLRPSTQDLIQAFARDAAILISSVSAWEIAQLADLNRIELDVPPWDWIERFASVPGIRWVPLSPSAASRAYRLNGLAHRDPADRLLIATAIEMECPLVTYDRLILNFARDHGDAHGFQALS